MTTKLDSLLPLVQKPARYTGGEYRAIVKNKDEVDTRFAFCFPDSYEIGMSNLGMRILYGILNEMDGVWCERVFAPWQDMEAQMRSHGLPLYALESFDPISAFDLVGFTIGYEMCYTNVLNMLDLAGIPLRTAERDGWDTPVVLAGGTCCYNPEPLHAFVDMFLLGEGEELLPELVTCYRNARKDGCTKAEFFVRAAQVGGVYVPSLYDVTYNDDGTVAAITPAEGAQFPVVKRVVEDFDRAYFPTKTIIPSTEIVHDRVMLEVFRGCIRGCRFCQAGYAYRPVRARSAETIIAQGKEAAQDSGYQEITLSSLSTSDYRPLEQACDGLLEWCLPKHVSLSLPSLRADNFSMGLVERIQTGRKSSLTFAPEAGTQRLRDAINKNVSEEELLLSCRRAFQGGWNAVKLYFMLGLPTETDEDVLGIADLANKVYYEWKSYGSNKARGVRITVSTSFFVPKCHTAFQWEGQLDMEEYRRRVYLLKNTIKNKSIQYNYHDPETSFLEAVFARGDRRLADAVELAWKKGAKFDSWSEFFDLDRWLEAFRETDVDPDFYARRDRCREELLPWEITSTGVRKDYLWQERGQSYAAAITPDCRVQCTACGANCFLSGGVCDA